MKKINWTGLRGEKFTMVEKNIYQRIKWFFKNIFYGIYFGYPLCCVWYFTKHSFLGIPVGIFDRVFKNKIHDLPRVVCDKCYKKI